MRTYMVVERFHPGRIAEAYDRFERQGRLLPDGLHYIDSWLAPDEEVCFQLMRTDDPDLFPIWIARWSDLVDFEVFPLR